MWGVGGETYNLMRMVRLIAELEAEAPVFTWRAIATMSSSDLGGDPGGGNETMN